MNFPTAIVIASVLAGLSIVGATVGNHFLENHYELAATVAGDTNLPWRLNTRTGAIVVCELAKNPLAGNEGDGTGRSTRWWLNVGMSKRSGRTRTNERGHHLSLQGL